MFKPLYHITFQPSFTSLLDQFGFSLTNSVSLGIRASFFLLDLLLFSICSRSVSPSYSSILYFPMRNLWSCHIFLERSISLVSNKKKRIMISSFLEWDIHNLLNNCQSIKKWQICLFLFKMAPRSVQSELVEMRQLCEVLHQRMNKFDSRISASQFIFVG